MAAQEGKVEVAKLLLDNGASVDAAKQVRRLGAREGARFACGPLPLVSSAPRKWFLSPPGAGPEPGAARFGPLPKHPLIG
jgi:hypothetical protein